MELVNSVSKSLVIFFRKPVLIVAFVLVAHAARGSTTSKTLMLGRCRQYGDRRLLEVMEERNGPSGLRDDDDDDDDDLYFVRLLKR